MRTLVVVLTALFLVGCEGVLYWHDYPKSQYRPLNMSRIKVGMTEDGVRKILGEPADIIGSLKDEKGRIVEVLQYMEAQFSYASGHDHLKKDYYLYFVDGNLVRWGRPGDWKSEAEYIIEHRYKLELDKPESIVPEQNPPRPAQKL